MSKRVVGRLAGEIVLDDMSYKRSRLYTLGFRLAIRVEAVCRQFPKHEQHGLARQLRAASRSVVANYVEGFVRQNYFPRDYRRFMTYSQGSCDETKFWLELAASIQLIPRTVSEELLSGYSEVGKLLTPLPRKRD